MLHVEEQELKAFKTMVKETKSRLIAERKKLEREIKDFRRLKGLSDESETKRIDMIIVERKSQVDKIKYELGEYNFPITQILPVRYGQNIYNYILLQEIKKKLKGFVVSMKVDNRGVMVIDYCKRPKEQAGCFYINPLGYVGAVTLRTPVATLES